MSCHRHTWPFSPITPVYFPLYYLRQTGCGCYRSFCKAMSFGMRNEKGVALKSPRRSPSPSGTAVLPEHPLEVLYRSPSADGTAILTEKELDWLQSGVVFPRAPPLQKGPSSVSWRQVKRRERRAARKFWVPPFATLHRRATPPPCKLSGVSGQLQLGRSQRLGRIAPSGPAAPSLTAALKVQSLTVPHSAGAPSGCWVNLVIERRRQSRKAVNRELHALNGNTATPDAATLMRNVRQRVRMANDDELDASLAPTVVVPPSPAPPADLFFGANIQPDLAMLDDDGLDDFVPATVVHAPTSAHQYMV